MALNEDTLSQVLREELVRAERILNSHDSNIIEGLQFRLQHMYGYLIYIHDNNLAANVVSMEVLQTLRQLINSIQAIVHTHQDQFPSYITSIVATNRKGRPRYDLSIDQLMYFLEHGFTCKMISEMLGISERTIRRRMSEYNLSVRQTYSVIPDSELKVLVTEAHQSFPNAGYRFVHGWLMTKGVKVQENRVRILMREVDPVGVTNRFFQSIHRRTYSVAGSQALWHLDGNHKLIRWRLVVHGAIDGYSRLVVYLKCSPNNFAATVLNLFMQAVQEYGLPVRIRCDQGVENYDVGMFMLTHPQRGPASNSVIVGKSVHNQRIERLWRDVFQGVSCTYYYLFNHLESEGLLDPLNEKDLFSLHYVYINIINHHLHQWTGAWNTHKMSSVNNKTPMQMWIEGSLSDGLDEINEVVTVQGDYGIDWNGPVSTETEENEENSISVPNISCSISDTDRQMLFQTIPNDHLSSLQDGSYGVNKYLQVRMFLHNH